MDGVSFFCVKERLDRGCYVHLSSICVLLFICVLSTLIPHPVWPESRWCKHATYCSVCLAPHGAVARPPAGVFAQLCVSVTTVCDCLAFESQSPPPVTEGGVQREDDWVKNRCCLLSQPNCLNCTVCNMCTCLCAKPLLFLQRVHVQKLKVSHTLMLWVHAYFCEKNKIGVTERQLDSAVRTAVEILDTVAECYGRNFVFFQPCTSFLYLFRYLCLWEGWKIFKEMPSKCQKVAKSFKNCANGALLDSWICSLKNPHISVCGLSTGKKG